MIENRIFITGGASGLGKAVALHFAHKGFCVCIGDINNEQGKEVEAELIAINPESFYIDCDVTKIKDLEYVKAQLKSRWKGVDVVVNNAGIGGSAGALEDISLDDWQWALSINLMGVVRGCKTFIPLFKKQGHGHFINIASAAGLLSPPFMSNYNATKAGVISLSETLEIELSNSNISTSVVCPAFFETNLTQSIRSKNTDALHKKVNKMMNSSDISADDIASSIYKAYSNKVFYVTPHSLERRMWIFKRLIPRGFRALMKYKTIRK